MGLAMKKLFLASVCWSMLIWPEIALATGQRPYWPASEVIEVPEGCIKWNWQQLSYYNYCPRAVRPAPNVVRVRG